MKCLSKVLVLGTALALPYLSISQLSAASPSEPVTAKQKEESKGADVQNLNATNLSDLEKSLNDLQNWWNGKGPSRATALGRIKEQVTNLEGKLPTFVQMGTDAGDLVKNLQSLLDALKKACSAIENAKSSEFPDEDAFPVTLKANVSPLITKMLQAVTKTKSTLSKK